MQSSDHHTSDLEGCFGELVVFFSDLAAIIPIPGRHSHSMISLNVKRPSLAEDFVLKRLQREKGAKFGEWRMLSKPCFKSWVWVNKDEHGKLNQWYQEMETCASSGQAIYQWLRVSRSTVPTNHLRSTLLQYHTSRITHPKWLNIFYISNPKSLIM